MVDCCTLGDSVDGPILVETSAGAIDVVAVGTGIVDFLVNLVKKPALFTYTHCGNAVPSPTHLSINLLRLPFSSVVILPAFSN